MIKWFIITIVGPYANVLERPSVVQQSWAKFDPPKPLKIGGIAWIGANREMSLPLLLHPLRILYTDQHTKPLLTERWEKRDPGPPEQHGSSGMCSKGSPAGMTANRSILWSRIEAPCRDHALTDR